MKPFKLFGAVVMVLAVFLAMGVMTVSAAGPVGVAYLDNMPHTIGANASALYRFDYSVNNDTGVHPITTITLVNGNNSGVGFEVWTADNVTDIPDNVPVGRGTPQTVDCDTGEVTGAGQCQSTYLLWSGAFGGTGAYYVRIVNSNNAPATFMLKIQGDGVSMGQMLANAPSGPAAAPALVATTSDDPNRAIAIDNNQHTIAANGATWYSFPYAILDDGTHPVKTITLANGNNIGVSFQVWSQDQFSGGWYNNKPIGLGTAMNVDCSSGVISGQGGCSSNDLVWSGAFGASGTIYVRVLNSNNAPASYTLTIQ